MSANELIHKYAPILLGLMVISAGLSASLFGTSIGLFLAIMLGTGGQSAIVTALLWVYPFEIPPPVSSRLVIIATALVTALLGAAIVYGLMV